MKVKRGYNKEQIIAERQNNVSSDVEELEEDLTIEPQNPERPFMNEEDYTDSDGSIYFRNSRKRRCILESETSDEEDLLDIRQHQRSPIWYTEKDNEFSSTPPPFVSPFEIKITGETPYEYFKNIFTDEIFEYIVRETIRYAVDCGKHSFHITVSEMKHFYGINIVMTYIRYPNYRLYWSSDVGLRLGLIADTMSLKRFEEIKRFLHYKNNHTIPNDCDDIFIKIRPLLDMLSMTFENAATLTEFQAIDEMIIPFKGRHRGKQCNKSKPKKWGFKCWVRASENGYVSKFEMYQKSKNISAEFGAIGDSVLRLSAGLDMKNHKLFMDNLFTSMKNKKFYHRIAFQFLNISITNSWILFNYDKKNKMSLLEFKASLANALIQIGERNKKRGRPCTISKSSIKSKSRIKVIPEIRLDSIGHFPLKVEHKNPPRCHDKNCTRRTRYICEKCKESVCPECMKSFHS